ncbi:MAG: hypothetical protein ACK5KM_01125 [Hyphomicrobiaceae bacterium]
MVFADGKQFRAADGPAFQITLRTLLDLHQPQKSQFDINAKRNTPMSSYMTRQFNRLNAYRPQHCLMLRGCGRMGAVAIALLLCLAPLAHAADEKAMPGWQSILSLQLKKNYNCDFDKVLFDREIETAGKKSLEGRARCLDGREFDFSRAAEHKKFDLRLCAPTVC